MREQLLWWDSTRPIQNINLTFRETLPCHLYICTKKLTAARKKYRAWATDVLQLHDPEFAPCLEILMEETMPALMECRSRGWCKALGLTRCTYHLTWLIGLYGRSRITCLVIEKVITMPSNFEAILSDLDCHNRNI
jgi:hypothetical protein